MTCLAHNGRNQPWHDTGNLTGLLCPCGKWPETLCPVSTLFLLATHHKRCKDVTAVQQQYITAWRSHRFLRQISLARMLADRPLSDHCCSFQKRVHLCMQRCSGRPLFALGGWLQRKKKSRDGPVRYHVIYGTKLFLRSTAVLASLPHWFYRNGTRDLEHSWSLIQLLLCESSTARDRWVQRTFVLLHFILNLIR